MESQREYDAQNLFQIFKFYTTFFGHDLTSLGLFTKVFLFMDFLIDGQISSFCPDQSEAEG